MAAHRHDEHGCEVHLDHSKSSIKAPFAVDMSMHAENRARVAAGLRAAGSAPGAIVLLEGGKSSEHHDTDHEPLFRQESNFAYLFGVKEPDCYGVVEVDTGKATLFIPRLPAAYGVWMGTIRPPSDFLAEYGVAEVKFTDELAATVSALAPSVIHVTTGFNSDSKRHAVAATYEGIAAHTTSGDLLSAVLAECRVIKTAKEIELLRYVNAVSSEAHMAVMRHARPGLRESQLESIFLHWCYYYGAARQVSYTCICAAGNNGATLHYGHAGAPNASTLGASEMCLFDMGCKYHHYSSDITVAFPSNGKFTDDQRAIYETVLAMQWAVEAAMKPGVSWTDMHALAYRVGLERLRSIGILKGTVEQLEAVNMGAVFMAHGLGHFMGVDTHDVGGYPAGGPARSTLSGYRSLRTARVLQAGMVITVEPGIYFNDYCLQEALADPKQSALINADVLARFRGFGGVRLEDDVLVTEDGCDVLTQVPRTVTDVEAVCAGTKWVREELETRLTAHRK